ncbi:MAG: DUF3772 domain-containing protein [Pseudomonadota bacterium]
MLLTGLALSSAHAQNGDQIANWTALLDRWTAQLDTAEKQVDRRANNGQPLPEVRSDLASVRSRAGALIDDIEPQLRRAQAQLAALTDPPAGQSAADTSSDKASDTSEASPPPAAGGGAVNGGASQPVRERFRQVRAALEDEIATYIQLGNTARLLRERIDFLFDRVDRLRRERLQSELLRQVPMPLSPTFWNGLATSGARVFSQMQILGGDFINRAAPFWPLALLTLVALLVTAGLRTGLRHLLSHRQSNAHEDAAFMTRAQSALQASFARALPPFVGLGIMLLGMSGLGLLSATVAPIVQGVAWAGAVYVVLWALTKSVLAPNSPGWRLVDLRDTAARRMVFWLHCLILIVTADKIFSAFGKGLVTPDNLNNLQDLVLILSAVTVVFALLQLDWSAPRRSADEVDDTGDGQGAQQTVSRPRVVASVLSSPVLKASTTVLAVSALTCAVTGYLPLGRFIVFQSVLVATLIAAFWLAHRAFRETVDGMLELGQADEESWLQANFGLGSTQRSLVSGVVTICFDLAMLAVVVGIVVLQWGVSTSTITDWIYKALFDLRVGDFDISMSRIAIAIFIFAVILLVVRQMQQWLDQRIVQPQRLDTGLANSLHTGIGYVGFLIAAIAGVSYIGIDFTNLAIVAGALSVGIGFGLQSIVNNFVSGLILLIERPLKIGDWVVAGDAEGYVKRISVRSTEIETFDRSTVIVPNADLISNRVTNWTHRNSMGRVVIRIGVGYASMPEKVEELMVQAAREHSLVLYHPAPFVVFEDFGDSALVFSLRCYIADVNTTLRVHSDLRLAVLAKFRAENVEIPFPQQDLHLRDLDGVKEKVGAALERAREEIRARRARDEGAFSQPPRATPAGANAPGGFNARSHDQDHGDGAPDNGAEND